MARFAGRWQYEARFRTAPDQAPEISRDQADYEMILGGPYMRSRYSGTNRGQPFESLGLEGYDNARQEYVSVWFNNMSTGVVVARGQLQDDGRTIVYRGSRTDPQTGRAIRFRSVWTSVDASAGPLKASKRSTGVNSGR